MTKPCATIRPGTRADAPRLAALRFEFRSSLAAAEQSEDVFIPRCIKWMEERLETDRWHCWIAETEDVVVGTVWLEMLEKIPNPGSEPEFHAYLTNFYVRDALRGIGIGSKLMDALVEWCKTSGIHIIFLWPTDRTRALYERHGFASDGDAMQRALAPRVH